MYEIHVHVHVPPSGSDAVPMFGAAEVLPFAEVMGPPPVDPGRAAKEAGMNPLLLALLLKLGEVGLQMLADWLEKRRKPAA